MGKKGDFPTGLLPYVLEYFQQKGQVPEIRDLRIVPKPRLGLFTYSPVHPPRPEQQDAAKACKRSRRGIVVAPTGLGKSQIIELIINELQVPTLIVVPTLSLKHQLRESLTKAFGSLVHIRVENVDALDPKAPLKGYDCVIIDEFHHSGAATYRKLNKIAWKGVYYKFGLTATPFRSRDEERLLLESVLSQVIYRVEYKTAVEKGYIVPIEAYYYELPVIEPKGNEFNWHSMYSELVVNNEKRNLLLADIIVKLHIAGISALCLVKEIAHGERLQEMLTDAFNFANGEAGTARHLIDLFNDRKIKVLIGTNGVLGEGVDTRPAEFVIIGGLGKSKNAFMQQCGRGVRNYAGKESCKVILIKDASHKWMLDHFKKQCKYLKEEYGVKPTKLELPEGL